MKSLLLWFLKRIQQIAMKLAQWAKTHADSLELPAASPSLIETRQAGEPPVDWLARLQQASQPPAHWLEYIQSKTGQMPQMMDMASMVSQQDSLPQSKVMPPVPAAPMLQNELKQPKAESRPGNWRQQQKRVRTVIEELPMPQSKDAAILSYQSPVNNRLPKHLHWRIQKPRGESVFEMQSPEASRPESIMPSYPDLQESRKSRVNYAKARKHTPKKAGYRLLKRGLRAKVAYQAGLARGEKAVPAWQLMKQSQARGQSLYQTMQSQGKAAAASYQQPESSPSAKASYPVPQPVAEAQSRYQSPEAPKPAETAYRKLGQDNPMTALHFAEPMPQREAQSEYQSPQSPSETQADYRAPEQAVNNQSNYPAENRTYRDNSLNFASPSGKRVPTMPEMASGAGSRQASETRDAAVPLVNEATAPKKLPQPPNYHEAAQATSADTVYRQPTQDPAAKKPRYASPEASQQSMGRYGNSRPVKNQSSQYSQSAKGQESQSHFVQTQSITEPAQAFASASNDYWIALPNEAAIFSESSPEQKKSRLDAEQRGEF